MATDSESYEKYGLRYLHKITNVCQIRSIIFQLICRIWEKLQSVMENLQNSLFGYKGHT
jgi:hypothetical protein